MSTQRNKQKCRLVSSAPPNSSTRKKHVHFREIQTDEPKRRCEDQTNRTWSTIQNASVQDTENSFLPSYSHTLSSGSDSILNTPESTLAHNQSFYRLPEDLLARGDFIAYQSGNVFDFFNSTNQTRPQRVSEICLVNDHYILVKIPESRQSRDFNMESIVEEGESSTGDTGHEQGRRKVFRCFPCQRNRRVLPAPMEIGRKNGPESIASAITGKTRSICPFKCPLAHCWRVNEKPEVFDTHTQIFGVFWKQKMANKVITIQPSKGETEAPLDLRIKSERNTVTTVNLAKDNNNQIDTEVFGSPLNAPTKIKPRSVMGIPLQSSLHEAVSLEQHSAWINDDTSDYKQLNFMKNKSVSLTDNKIKQTQRRSNVFHWFFKRPKTSKPKSKIHAVVYKTYFVRWKKPPDDICPHCGHNRNDKTPTVVSCKWRRCRSATF